MKMKIASLYGSVIVSVATCVIRQKGALSATTTDNSYCKADTLAVDRGEWFKGHFVVFVDILHINFLFIN